MAAREVPSVVGLFISGSSVGGFCGRFVTAAVADLAGWRAVLCRRVALFTLAGALIVTFALPRERNFVRSGGFASSGGKCSAHLRNPRLLAIYAVGFGVLVQFRRRVHLREFSSGRDRPISFRRRFSARCLPTYLAGSVRCAVGWPRHRRCLAAAACLGIIAVWIVRRAPLWRRRSP